jgi:predicted transcriptional regulator
LAGKTGITVFLMLVIILTVPITAFETGGYEVRPAHDISSDDTARYFIPVSSTSPFMDEPEPQQIDYSDLPTAILLILAITGFLSLLVYLIKLLLSGNLPIISGLVKLRRKELLDNASRNLVYTAIRENPGINPSDIERITKLTNKNVTYHLNKLLDYHMIVVEKSANGKGYFQNSATYSSNDRILLLHSKNPTERMIIEILLANPGISRKEIGVIAGISGPSVSWHISRLESDYIVEKIKRGTVVHHYIKDNFKGLFKVLTGIQERGCVREN